MARGEATEAHDGIPSQTSQARNGPAAGPLFRMRGGRDTAISITDAVHDTVPIQHLPPGQPAEDEWVEIGSDEEG